jgi:hypothetical protein
MNKSGVEKSLLIAGPDGWVLHFPGRESPQNFPTLEAAAEALIAGTPVHLVVPAHFVLIERLTLPSTDRAELEGMVLLQLEKTLPYPVEEAVCHFEVVSEAEQESVLVSFAMHVGTLDALCAPLRAKGSLPVKISLSAMLTVAGCEPDQLTLCIWGELGRIQLAVCQNGRLGAVYSVPGDVPLAQTLPQVLLQAEMEGVPVEFQQVRLSRQCAPLEGSVLDALACPVEVVEEDVGGAEKVPNLVPASWRAEIVRSQKVGRRRQQLQMAAVLYLVVVAAAFLSLAWLKSRLNKVDSQIAGLKPQLEGIQSRQMRWQALAPAVSPDQYTLEVLRLAFSCLPSPEVKITTFQHGPGQFRIEGEAPSANLAIDFVDRLKAQEGLSDYQIDSPPPSILPSGSARYNVFGKL